MNFINIEIKSNVEVENVLNGSIQIFLDKYLQLTNVNLINHVVIYIPAVLIFT